MGSRRLTSNNGFAGEFDMVTMLISEYSVHGDIHLKTVSLP